MVEALVFTTPDLLGTEAAAALADLEGTGTHTVTGRTIDDVFKHDRAGSGGDFVGEGRAPQHLAIARRDSHETSLSEEDALMHAVDVGDHGSGVGHFVVLAFPQNFAGGLVETEQRLTSTTTAHHEHVSVDDGRCGVLPFDLHSSVVLHDIEIPHGLAGGCIEAEDAEVRIDGIDFVTIDHGRGAWAVATFVVICAGVTTAIVFADHGQRLLPELLAVPDIKADDDLTHVAIRFTGDDGEGLGSGHGEGAEARRGVRLPQRFDFGALPIADFEHGRGAIVVRAAEFGPFGRGGGLSGKAGRCEQRTTGEEKRGADHFGVVEGERVQTRHGAAVLRFLPTGQTKPPQSGCADHFDPSGS